MCKLASVCGIHFKPALVLLLFSLSFQQCIKIHQRSKLSVSTVSTGLNRLTSTIHNLNLRFRIINISQFSCSKPKTTGRYSIFDDIFQVVRYAVVLVSPRGHGAKENKKINHHNSHPV